MPRRCRSVDARPSLRSGRKVPAPLSPPKSVRHSSWLPDSPTFQLAINATSAPSLISLLPNRAARRQTNAFGIQQNAGDGHGRLKQSAVIQARPKTRVRRSSISESASETATLASSTSTTLRPSRAAACQASPFKIAGDDSLKRIANGQAT